jgi:hypothetical protein
MRISRITLAAATTAAVASVVLLAGRSHVFAQNTTTQPQQIAQAAPPPPPSEQTPAGAPPQGPPHEMPAPTNLKVLPSNLTGAQVHEIMEKWEGELGTSCKTCHAADPKNVGPNGRPRLNFAADSKDEKKTARVMFKMVEDINAGYISKIDSSGEPVSCGTCHRGHLSPEPFAAAPEHAPAH